jgi:hypothetical protein
MSFYKEMEKIIKNNGADGLCHLLEYYGMELDLQRQTKDSVYSRVHGRDAGQPEKFVKKFVGVLQGDDFFESGNSLSPSFQAGFLYADECDILVGDVILIVSDDTRRRRYKITAQETIGLTTTVFKKWKLSSLGA